MTKVTVKTLRQWTEPNGVTHNPGDECEIDTSVPGMDFEEHLLAQGVVEVVQKPAPKGRGKQDTVESEVTDATG